MTQERTIDVDPGTGIFADRDGRIRAWGTAWEETFGYGPGEAIGQSLDLIIPRVLQPIHWHGFTRAVRTGKLKGRAGATIRVPAVHRNGSIVPAVFVDLTVVPGEDGTVEGIGLTFARIDPGWVGAIYRVVLIAFAAGQWAWGRLRAVGTRTRS
jgi:PAS domain S-box-containing protein